MNDHLIVLRDDGEIARLRRRASDVSGVRDLDARPVGWVVGRLLAHGTSVHLTYLKDIHIADVARSLYGRARPRPHDAADVIGVGARRRVIDEDRPRVGHDNRAAAACRVLPDLVSVAVEPKENLRVA